jgi:drug/metabolite transporter (DMT)-like permease
MARSRKLNVAPIRSSGETISELPDVPPSEKQVSWAGLFYLSVVYVFWGSTYLGIRIAVREGSGFPPFTMAGLRVLVGGMLLLLWSAGTRRRVRLSRQEMAVLAISGLLLWLGGNGLVTWAEQRAHSGYAALLIAAVPIWVALIEAVLDWKAPSGLLIGSLLIGFAGIVLLSVPMLASGVRADMWSLIALLLAGLSWGSGTVLQSRKPVSLAARVSSGYQQIFAGLGFVLVALLIREPRPDPAPEAWLAWGYLVLFGSVFAFTSFVQALRLLPISVAMTYAYVNPVIAMILGWLILREPITGWTLGGAALVLLGVAGIFRTRYSETSTD